MGKCTYVGQRILLLLARINRDDQDFPHYVGQAGTSAEICKRETHSPSVAIVMTAPRDRQASGVVPNEASLFLELASSSSPGCQQIYCHGVLKKVMDVLRTNVPIIELARWDLCYISHGHLRYQGPH